jgi:glycerophosphoryl diester phosphodiesterase
VVAHRGACLVAVENTIDAFAQALALGAGAIETDVRMTRGGELVLFHDATLERLAGRPERIADVTWAALREMPLGPAPSTARACRLADVYPLVRGHGRARLLLDLKVPADCAPALRRSLEASGIQERIVLGIRTVEELRAIRREMPNLTTLGFGTSPEVEWDLADAGIDVVVVRSTWLAAEAVARARSYGRPIWAIGGGRGTSLPMATSPLAELLTYRRLGFDAVIVNDVALAVRANAEELE